jgi:hypothetical protein
MTIRWFYGFVGYANSWSKEITFGKDGLRKEILKKKAVCTIIREIRTKDDRNYQA